MKWGIDGDGDVERGDVLMGRRKEKRKTRNKSQGRDKREEPTNRVVKKCIYLSTVTINCGCGGSIGTVTSEFSSSFIFLFFSHIPELFS